MQLIIPTIHALKRAQARGITSEMILDTVRHGKIIRKQGYRYYVMLKKCLPHTSNKQYLEKIQNVTVILSDSDQIVTVYKNSCALKHIKRKKKRLS